VGVGRGQDNEVSGACERLNVLQRVLVSGAFASCVAAGSGWAGGEPTRAAAVPEQGIRLLDEGGICDGVTDDSKAIARALERAKALRLPVIIPKGKCAFGDIIRVDSAALTGSGDDSVLHSLNWRRAAIFMSGAAPSVSNVKLTGVPAPSRQAPWEMTKITVFGATDFVIDHVTIEGAPAAGIQTADQPNRGRITNNVIRNTLSDSIHLTGGASNILVESNLIEYSGDDGIAVVSYMKDPVRVNNITARNNVVRNNRFGRNMSVVGGSQVLYENNLLQGNLAGLACLYIAQEGGGMPTKGNDEVRAEYNTIQNCGGGPSGHGGALIYSEGLQANNNILLRYNDFQQKGQTGIRIYSSGNHGVILEGNRISNASPALNISTPGVTVKPYSSGAVGYTNGR
jgi:hypothetical protein